MILLDSDHFGVLLENRHALRTPLAARLDSVAEPLALPIVVVEEHLRGWLALLHRVRLAHQQTVPYLRLRKLLDVVSEWQIVDWNESVADKFEGLRKQRIRIGTQDLKIASIALAHDALLLSANLVHFSKVPGLRVEDWLYGHS